MNILRVRDTKILNFKSARSLLSTFFVCAARAQLYEFRLELGGRWHIRQQRSPDISDLSKSLLYWSTDFTSELVEREHSHSTARWVMTIEVRLGIHLPMYSKANGPSASRN
jgi:hypothetical protein